MTIEAITAVTNMDAVKGSNAISNITAPGFEQTLVDSISNVNDSLNKADVVLTDMALNKPISAHEVMLTMEKAKMELRLIVEVRNKLLEGYQELMRMQV